MEQLDELKAKLIEVDNLIENILDDEPESECGKYRVLEKSGTLFCNAAVAYTLSDLISR